MLSDHLIASSELCGHLIGVTAFGLQFVGHPEYIRDERYERNQFMFNVCFVFDALTDVGAYRALISKVAKDFRTIETNHRFLSSHETRDRIEEVISGILSDIKRTGQLHMPPTGVDDIPISSESIGSDSLLLQHGPMLDKLPEVHAHEVPVWVAPSQDCSEYLPAYPFLAQLMPFFTEDGRTGGSDVASIARRTAQPLAQVINLVAVLTQRGAVRLVDRISMTNVYVCTRALSELPGDGSLRTQCVQECRATGANSAPLCAGCICNAVSSIAIDTATRLSVSSSPPDPLTCSSPPSVLGGGTRSAVADGTIDCVGEGLQGTSRWRCDRATQQSASEGCSSNTYLSTLPRHVPSARQHGDTGQARAYARAWSVICLIQSRLMMQADLHTLLGLSGHHEGQTHLYTSDASARRVKRHNSPEPSEPPSPDSTTGPNRPAPRSPAAWSSALASACGSGVSVTPSGDPRSVMPLPKPRCAWSSRAAACAFRPGISAESSRR